MPVYEFSCDDCGKKFDIVATLAEKEAGLHPLCPYCGSMKIHQVFGRFTVMGSSKTDMDFDESDFGGEDYGEDLGGDFDELGDENSELEEDSGEDIEGSDLED